MADLGYSPVARLTSKKKSAGALQRERRNSELDEKLGTRQAVEANSMESFGNMCYKMSGLYWSALVVGGFCSPRGGKAFVQIYLGVWLISFGICFLTCFSNCFIQAPPFHVWWADIMVALVHVPGFYSVICWRRLLDRPDSSIWRLLTRASGTEAELTWFTRCIAPFLFPAQMAVVCLVWAGYAWPIELYLEHEPDDMSAEFHAKSMWIVIPPVVANVVANAAFFAFFCYAHYLQVDMVLSKMGAFYEATDQGWSVMDEENHSGMTDEEQIDDIINQVFAVQDELDDDCREWSGLVTAFMTWALGAITAVTCDFISYLSGTEGFEFTIWIVLIDLFLAAAGLMMVCGFLIMGAILTKRMDDLSIESIACMRARRVPMSKAAASYTYIQTGGRKTGLGFKIYGLRIDWSYVATFISLVVTILGLVLTTVKPPSQGNKVFLTHNSAVQALHR